MKKNCVFRVTGLKILGWVGIHNYLIIFFSGKKYDFIHFERHFAILKAILPFKKHRIIFFPDNLKKILSFTSKFR